MPFLVSGSWLLTITCFRNVVAWEAAQTCPVIKNLEANALWPVRLWPRFRPAAGASNPILAVETLQQDRCLTT